MIKNYKSFPFSVLNLFKEEFEMSRKLLSIILIVVLVSAMIPMVAWAAGVTITTDKPAYTINEKMVITISGNTSDDAFVSIYQKGARVDQYGPYEYVNSLIAGKWEVNAPSEAGEYEIRVYTNDHDEGSLLAKIPLEVKYITDRVATIKLDKAAYTPNENMVVIVEGVSKAQMDSSAFVSIYKKGARHDQYGVYAYIRDLIANKWEVAAPYETGEYEMRVYAADHAYTDEALLVSVPFTVSGNPIEFSEGYEGISGWAVGEINEAVSNNLITEKVVVEFQKPITREEFAELAIKLYEAITGKVAEPAPASTFTDTTNPEILKAYNLDIIKGVGDGKFAPANPVTRQEIATMLLRVIKAALPNVDTSVASPAVFTDDYEIADWAREGINYFASKGIIKGANGAFLPLANTTREAAIALIKRTFDSFSEI